MNKSVIELKKNNYIFVSVPKTGTNSIWDKILKPGEKFRPFQHTKGLTIKNHIGSDEWDKRFSFACVRNPYNMIKSWYDYHKTHDDIGQHIKDFYPDTFEQWVGEGFKTHWELQSHKKLNPFWDGTNPLHQHMWVTDNNGGIIVNHIMKQETLQEDFKIVTEKFGFNNDLNRLNTSNNDSKLNNKVKEMIYETFSKDFILFGYDK